MGKHLVEFYGTPRGWISIKPVFPRVKISQNSSFSILNQNFCLKIHLKNRFIRIKSIPKKIQNNEKKIKTKKKHYGHRKTSNILPMRLNLVSKKMYLICRGLRGLAPPPAGPSPRQGFQAPPPAGPSPRQTFQAPPPAGSSPRTRLQAPPPAGPDPAGARPCRGRGLAGAYPGLRKTLI